MVNVSYLVPVQVICGGKKFFAQLNEKWNSNSSTPIENQVIQPLGPSTRKNVKIHTEDILLCIARGENESSVLMSSAMVPQDGTLVIINVSNINFFSSLFELVTQNSDYYLLCF